MREKREVNPPHLISARQKSVEKVHLWLLKRGCRRRRRLERNVVHGRAELDADGFIRAEENDKRTHIKKFAENFIFFVKIRHIKYIKQKKIILRNEAGIIWQKTLPRLSL